MEVFEFTRVQIGSGVTINCSGTEPVAILSQGNMSIAGTIDNDGASAGEGSGSGAAGGAGGAAGGAGEEDSASDGNGTGGGDIGLE